MPSGSLESPPLKLTVNGAWPAVTSAFGMDTGGWFALTVTVTVLVSDWPSVSVTVKAAE